MSTISNNTNEALVKKFVKHPRQFESYYKHCINILKEYTWMKKNQYNVEISNYEYISRFVNYYGISQYLFDVLFDDYKNTIINNNPKHSLLYLHSNIYYPDNIEYFMNKILIDENKLPDCKHNLNFKRLDFSIITNNDLDLNREYTLNDIYNLIINKEITVIDCHLSNTKIDINEVNFNSNNRIFKGRNCCEILEFDNTPTETYYSLNDQNKELWTKIFEPFCDYLRLYAINFNEYKKNHINMNADFYQVLTHINDINKATLKYYKKRKKEIPLIIKNTLNKNLQLIEKYQKDFDSINTSEIILNHYINVDDKCKKLIKK